MPGRRRNHLLVTGAGITGLVVLIALASLAVPPSRTTTQDLSQRLAGPGAGHWLGLDEVGRDVGWRLWYGARVSLLVAVTVSLCSLLLGTALGLVAGWCGGWIDEGLMRVVDLFLAFPGLLLALALVAVLGPSLVNLCLALVVVGWVAYARLVRGQVLKLKALEFIQAARAAGVPSWRILWRHLLPNALAPVLVQVTVGVAAIVVAEAGMSFLGLGVQPPIPSWGGMLNAGVNHLLQAPHLAAFPAACIFITVLGFNLLGDGLRDRIDPRTGG